MKAQIKGWGSWRILGGLAGIFLLILFTTFDSLLKAISPELHASYSDFMINNTYFSFAIWGVLGVVFIWSFLSIMTRDKKKS